MKKKSPFLIFGCMFFIHYMHAQSTADAQPSYVLTMDQAVDLAIKHRPDLQALSYAIQAAKSGAKAELAGYYPLVTLNTSFTYAQGQSYAANNTILDAKQLIYSFAGPQQRYRRAKTLAEQAAYEWEIQKNATRFATEIAFLQAWLQQETQKTITALQNSSTVSFAQSEHEQELKLLDKAVWLKAVEDYGNAASHIEQYTFDLPSAYKHLELLMGEAQSLTIQNEKTDDDMSNNTPIQSTLLIWHPSKNISLNSLTHYYDLAFHHRPELKQATKKIEFEQRSIKIAQGLLLPSFSIDAQAGHLATIGETFGTPRNQPLYSIGIGATWTIFDGLVNQYQEQQAYANKIKEVLYREQTTLMIKQEVQEKYYALLTSLSRIKSQKLSYLRQSNDFVRSQQEYEIGNISPVEFALAQTTWESAQLDWYARNIDGAMAECSLMYTCGYPPHIHPTDSQEEKHEDISQHCTPHP